MQTTRPTNIFKTLTTRLLLLFLVVTFAVWGIGDIARGGPQINVAKVGERGITIMAFQQELSQIRSDSAQKMPEELLNSDAFSQQVMAKLVQNALVEESASAAGIVIAEDAVAEKLRNDPYFQDLRGKFDAKMFRDFLASQRITESQFVDSISRQTRAQVMVAAYQMDQVSQMPILAALEAYSDAEMRDVFLATIPASSIDVKPPSDVDLHAFYDANAEALFMQPEARDIELMTINADAIKTQAKKLAKSEVPDATATAAYLQTLSDKIDDAVASGTDFSDMAEILSVSTQLKTLPRITKEANSIDARLVSSAFSLDQGQISPVITLPNGDLCVVNVTRVYESKPKPFEDVVSKISEMVMENAKSRAVAEKGHALAAALQDAGDDNARLEIAKSMGIRAKIIEKMGRKTSEENISLSLRSELFSKKPGEFIAPAPYEGGVLVPVVSAVYAPENPPSPTKDHEAQALRIVQGMVSNGLLNDFEGGVPVTIYGLPEAASQ